MFDEHGRSPRASKGIQRCRHSAMACAMATLFAATPAATAQSMGPFGASVSPAPVAFDLPAQPLADALRQFERQARQEVRADASLLQGRTSKAVSGSLGTTQALEQLISGTGLIIGPSRGAIMTLVPAPASAPASTETAEEAPAEAAAGTLSTVVVTADALGDITENSGSYTTGGVTIGKTTRSLKETPQSVTVMTRYRLDDQNMRTIDDALLSAPGIIAEYQSSTERKFYSRGFEIDQIQYDGVPAERGNGFSTSPDLAPFDRVEILRGPAGLFNGAGQPGGTVNLVRKRPTPYAQYQAQARLGTWNFKRLDVDLSTPLNAAGNLRGRLIAAREDRDFFYDYATAKKDVLYGIVETDLGSQTTLGLGVHYERTDSIPYYTGLPRYTDGSDIGLPRSTYNNGGWSKSDIRNMTLFADLNHRFNNDWKLKVGLSHLTENNTEYTGAAYGTINRDTLAGGMISAFSQHLVGKQTVLDANVEGSFDAWGRRHDVLFGANYQKRNYELDSQAYEGFAYNPFTYNPADYTDPLTKPSRAARSTDTEREQMGLYGSMRLAVADRTKLIFGGRLSQWETKTLDRVTGNVSAQYKDDNVFTSFGALTYDLTPTWMVYGSYAEIFRSQADRYTAAGRRLDPVTGNNMELGLKGALFDGKLNASVALFRTTEDNRSSIDPDNPSPCAASPTGGPCYVAEGKVRSQGLDAELTGAITPRWQMSLGYTFNQTKYLRDPASSGAPSGNEGQPLASFTPKHLLRVWTAYKLPGAASAWTVAGGVNFQTKTFKTNASSNNSNAPSLYVEQPKYAVWSTRISWQITRHVQAALNINNIFDKRYYRTIGTGTGNWYGEPRNVMLSLHAAF